MKVLGLIKSHCKHIENVDALRQVHCSYIRSNLDYCTLVWSPFLQGLKNSLENIQRAFLRFLRFNRKIPRELHADYIVQYLLP